MILGEVDFLAGAQAKVDSMIAQAKERAANVAQQAQPYASRTAWTALGMMIVSLAAAVGGALWGARRVEQQVVVPRPSRAMPAPKGFGQAEGRTSLRVLVEPPIARSLLPAPAGELIRRTTPTGPRSNGRVVSGPLQ